MRVVSIKMDEELIKVLDYVSGKYGISRSELVRQAIKYYLKRKGGYVFPRPVVKKVVLT